MILQRIFHDTNITGFLVAFIMQCDYVKGIGSILLLRNGLKKICRKNYKNHLRSNNYEVCTAVAHCFPNSLDVMVLENMNLSSDRNTATIIVVF
jgi:hypothetical protein